MGISLGKNSKLRAAAGAGDDEAVERNLAAGADIDAGDWAGETALMFAAKEGRTKTIRLLLEKGADIEATNILRQSALMLAACYDESGGGVRVLLEAGADADAADRFGDTALILATKKGNTRAARLLLEQGADANAAGYGSATALMYAAQRGGMGDVAERLLDAGADVNAAAKRGETALKFAAWTGHEKLAQRLKDAGAQDSLKEALKEAKERERAQAFALLPELPSFLMDVLLPLLRWIGGAIAALLHL